MFHVYIAYGLAYDALVKLPFKIAEFYPLEPSVSMLPLVTY